MFKLISITVALITTVASANESKKMLVCRGPIDTGVMLVPNHVDQRTTVGFTPLANIYFTPTDTPAGLGQNLAKGSCGFSDRGMTHADRNNIEAPLGNSNSWRVFFETRNLQTSVRVDLGQYNIVSSSSVVNRIIVIDVVPNTATESGGWMVDYTNPKAIRVN